MWLDLVLALLVFVLTAAESYTASRERSHESLAYIRVRRDGSPVPLAARLRHARRSAWWSVGFEAILIVDLVVGLENPWLLVAALPGAWVGQYLSVRRRVLKGAA